MPLLENDILYRHNFFFYNNNEIIFGWTKYLCNVSFLRISQFSTVTDQNPEYDGPCDMLGIFFLNVIFITLLKDSYSQKNLNSMHGFKSAILPKFNNSQNGTFEPMHEIQKKILSERPFLKHHKDDIYCNIYINTECRKIR